MKNLSFLILVEKFDRVVKTATYLALGRFWGETLFETLHMLSTLFGLCGKRRTWVDKFSPGLSQLQPARAEE